MSTLQKTTCCHVAMHSYKAQKGICTACPALRTGRVFAAKLFHVKIYKRSGFMVKAGVWKLD
eukprot:275522-Lingulodinium_polyedra.AAC.1